MAPARSGSSRAASATTTDRARSQRRQTKAASRNHLKRAAVTKPSTAPVPAVPMPTSEPSAGGKLVRDSFTMPKPEYSVLAELKLRAARLGRPIKKGELLRAGVAALRAMPDPSFLVALAGVPTLKPGRPKGSAPPDGPAHAPKGKKRRKSA